MYTGQGETGFHMVKIAKSCLRKSLPGDQDQHDCERAPQHPRQGTRKDRRPFEVQGVHHLLDLGTASSWDGRMK